MRVSKPGRHAAGPLGRLAHTPHTGAHPLTVRKSRVAEAPGWDSMPLPKGTRSDLK